jgi:flagellin
MANITLSAGVRANLTSLQSTAEMMNTVQQRLATGKKVNSAIDNPVNFFTAASLQARAGDLSTLLDSVSNAVQTINAADKGISAITKLVEAAKSTAKQALNASQPTMTYVANIQGGAIADDASVATGTVGSITGASTLASLGIADGEAITISDGTNTVTHTVGTAATEDVDDVITTLNGGAATWTVAINGGNLEVTADTNTTNLTISGNGADSVFGTTTASALTNADLGALSGNLTLQLGTGTVATIVFGSASGQVNTRAELATALTAAATTSGLTLSVNADDEIEIASTASGNVTIGGGAGVLTALGLTAGATTPTASIGTANTTRVSLQADYNELLTQISQLAADSSFNGVNLLDGDNLSVVFNEDGSSSLSINGVTFDAAGLGLTAQTGNAFQTDATINTLITALDDATATLRTTSSTFGSKLSIVQTRQDFTKNLINVLQVGADNLTLADSNEEGANLLALQTRQSLSTSALSMAVQADQNVLRLLQ